MENLTDRFYAEETIYIDDKEEKISNFLTETDLYLLRNFVSHGYGDAETRKRKEEIKDKIITQYVNYMFYMSKDELYEDINKSIQEGNYPMSMKVSGDNDLVTHITSMLNLTFIDFISKDKDELFSHIEKLIDFSYHKKDKTLFDILSDEKISTLAKETFVKQSEPRLNLKATDLNRVINYIFVVHDILRVVIIGLKEENEKMFVDNKYLAVMYVNTILHINGLTTFILTHRYDGIKHNLSYNGVYKRLQKSIADNYMLHDKTYERKVVESLGYTIKLQDLNMKNNLFLTHLISKNINIIYKRRRYKLTKVIDFLYDLVK